MVTFVDGVPWPQEMAAEHYACNLSADAGGGFVGDDGAAA